MKNIKQTIKNKAIINILLNATALGVYAVLKVKSNNKLIKEKEESIINNQSKSNDRKYLVNSKTTDVEDDWVNWGGVILAKHNQDPKELLEQMINDLNENMISIEEI